MVKPSVGSGSKGVRLVTSEPGLVLARAALAADGAQAVVEEYVAGPSLSIEVIALGGEVVTMLPTWLEFDAAYDCKRVVAPVGGAGGAAAGVAGGGGAADGAGGGGAADGAGGGGAADSASGGVVASVSDATLAALDEAARRLAEGVALGGVMDVEVMVAADGTPKVIEIDARLPSQTPAAVFHASDVNIVALLAEAFAADRPPAVSTARPTRRRVRARAGRGRPGRGARRAHRAVLPVRCVAATACTAPTWCSPTAPIRAPRGGAGSPC